MLDGLAKIVVDVWGNGHCFPSKTAEEGAKESERSGIREGLGVVCVEEDGV